MLNNMANLCENFLQITGEEKDLKKWIKALGKVEDDALMEVIPLKPDQDAREVWGTRYMTDLSELNTNPEDGYIEYYFNSAWAPPIEWLKLVSKKFKKLAFRIKYDEPGMGFMGVCSAENGETSDDSINY